MSERYAYLDHPGILAFSHRGGNNKWPENTMPAFQHSVDLGYRYLETDVHLSADGVLYAFHDDDLAERTGRSARFGDLLAAEIDTLLVDRIAPIPRFEEVVRAWPQAMLNIDAKSDASVEPLINAIRDYGLIDRVCIGSFSDRRIKKCRAELGHDLCTSMGPFEVARLWLAARGLADPSLLVAPCAQVPLRRFVNVVDQRFVDFAHNHDIQVHVWTINETEGMQHLIELGVDGIMTDLPALLRDALVKAEKWEAGRSLSQLES